MATPRTPFANLYVIDRTVDATTTTVGEFIDELSGANNSNMTIIDDKLKEISDSIGDGTITIKSNGDYVQSFSVNQHNDVVIDLDIPIVPPSVDPVLGNNTWSVISSVSAWIAEHGFTPGEVFNMLGWALGDPKPLTVGSITYALRFIDTCHDDLADGSGKAGMTFDLASGWGETAATPDLTRFNTSSTNLTGWDRSMMRLGAAGDGGTPIAGEAVIPNVRTAISNSNDGATGHRGSDLMQVVKTVNKPTATSGSDGSIVLSQDDLFLMSEREVFGNNNSSFPGEGEIYAWYQVNNTNIARQKPLPVGGINMVWWLRSPHMGNSTSIRQVTAFGMTGGMITNSPSLTSFALCI